jgi:hypothetical protein
MMRTTDGKLAILDFGLMTEVTVSLPCDYYTLPFTLVCQYCSLINHFILHLQK